MITFDVPGTPIPKGRPRVTTIGGYARMYTPAKTAHYECEVGAAARIAMRGAAPLSGPVRVVVDAYLPIPASWSKTRQRAAASDSGPRPTGKPDLDNICKAVLDGVNGVCFVDDAQVVQLETTKCYSVNPRVCVLIEAAA